MLGDQAENYARARNNMEAQLHGRRHVNEQQCHAVKLEAVDSQAQLNALQSLKKREAEANRKSTLQITKLIVRMQEFEAQLVDMRVQQENVTRDTLFQRYPRCWTD
jgi:hypothetical protein